MASTTSQLLAKEQSSLSVGEFSVIVYSTSFPCVFTGVSGSKIPTYSHLCFSFCSFLPMLPESYRML